MSDSALDNPSETAPTDNEERDKQQEDVDSRNFGIQVLAGEFKKFDPAGDGARPFE